MEVNWYLFTSRATELWWEYANGAHDIDVLDSNLSLSKFYKKSWVWNCLRRKLKLYSVPNVHEELIFADLEKTIIYQMHIIRQSDGSWHQDPNFGRYSAPSSGFSCQLVEEDHLSMFPRIPPESWAHLSKDNFLDSWFICSRNSG